MTTMITPVSSTKRRVVSGEAHVSSKPKQTKLRRITRSVTARARAAERDALFEKALAPVLSSGFLRWYEAEALGYTNKSSLATWEDLRETYQDWPTLLKELNAINCTNRCVHCEQTVYLKANRQCCTPTKWNIESQKRSVDFHGIIDIVMSSGVLTWREKGSVRRISKTCYKIYREQCTCRQSDRTVALRRYIEYDPRYSDDYDKLSHFQKCRVMTKYHRWMVKNLHSFYDFKRVADPSRLPYGLGGWAWFDIQMVTLQRTCPRRYAFVMNMVSLYIAQGELQRSPPTWYASAFLGERHDPVQGPAYEECLGAGISEFCLPATDELLTKFLRTKCYPSKATRAILGPLIHELSIFAPFFSMVSLNSEKKAKLPACLEQLSEEMIDNMSLQFFCTIS